MPTRLSVVSKEPYNLNEVQNRHLIQTHFFWSLSGLTSQVSPDFIVNLGSCRAFINSTLILLIIKLDEPRSESSHLLQII